MALPIEDYALIGDCRSAALVGRDGSIDWLCWPRFDLAACFAALLGTVENGRWLLAPQQPIIAVDRHYLPGTLILETEFKTATGRAAIVDFMPFEDGANLVRIAMGRCGYVDFRNEFIVRFNYGAIIPWASHLADGSVDAIAGPERVVLRTAAAVHDQEFMKPIIPLTAFRQVKEHFSLAASGLWIITSYRAAPKLGSCSIVCSRTAMTLVYSRSSSSRSPAACWEIFRKAFTHVGLINSALNLNRHVGCPAEERAETPMTRSDEYLRQFRSSRRMGDLSGTVRTRNLRTS